MSRDPSELSPQVRRSEIAEILARGLLRLWVKERAGASETASSGDLAAPQKISKSLQDSLDDGRTPGLPVVETAPSGEAR